MLWSRRVHGMVVKVISSPARSYLRLVYCICTKGSTAQQLPLAIKECHAGHAMQCQTCMRLRIQAAWGWNPHVQGGFQVPCTQLYSTKRTPTTRPNRDASTVQCQLSPYLDLARCLSLLLPPTATAQCGLLSLRPYHTCLPTNTVHAATRGHVGLAPRCARHARTRPHRLRQRIPGPPPLAPSTPTVCTTYHRPACMCSCLACI